MSDFNSRMLIGFRRFFLMADYDDYIKCQDRVGEMYQVRKYLAGN